VLVATGGDVRLEGARFKVLATAAPHILKCDTILFMITTPFMKASSDRQREVHSRLNAEVVERAACALWQKTRQLHSVRTCSTSALVAPQPRLPPSPFCPGQPRPALKVQNQKQMRYQARALHADRLGFQRCRSSGVSETLPRESSCNAPKVCR
jgi:hypothetical protein